MPLERRRVSRVDLEAVSRRHRTWGRWGDDDELGAANYATPERVAVAAQEILRGAVFSLGEVVQVEDLEECARQQGVEVAEGGDFLLVRTGYLAQCRARDDWGTYCGGTAPGLGVSAADFLCPRRVAGVATDTWGIEAIPYETADVRAPLHVVLLVNAGVRIGEMWDLEALGEDCAADGRYTFFLSAPPLTITGAVGSPINPLAIK
jgi:kynurenine formamidase